MKFSIKRTQRYALVAMLNRKIFGEGLDLDFSKHHCWVVRNEQGVAVGFCSYKEVDGDTAYFSRAGLLEEARGYHLQLRMIRTRIKACKKAGLKHVVTYTVPDNAPSFNSLQREGFRLYIPQNRWAGDAQLYWIRDL